MRDKYWAKERYGEIDPVVYELRRFTTPAGKLIDEVEKKTVLDLLMKNTIRENSRKIQILDVATGPGRLSFYLQEYLKKAEITGVDINENMLRRAKRLAKEKMSKVNFMKGDIYNLPFDHEQFDVITGLRFSMHLPNFDKVLAELSRILKKDGILIFDIFNLNSILKLRFFQNNQSRKDLGFYNIDEIVDIAKRNRFVLVDLRGILLLGETILRKTPHKLLTLFSPLVYPSKFIEQFSTKLILCFKKI